MQGRALTFKQFMQQALPLLAEVRGCEEAEVRPLAWESKHDLIRGFQVARQTCRCRMSAWEEEHSVAPLVFHVLASE